jgi:hypothetical protein
MAIPKSILILLFAFFLSCDLQAQKYMASDFVETQLPKSNSEEWRQFLDGAYFKVSIRKHILRFENWNSKDHDSVVKVVTDRGRIIGVDNGEWGGVLKFVDDAENETVIKKGNIRLLFEYQKNDYFIETGPGLFSKEDLSFKGEGTLFKLVLRDDVYDYEKVIHFDDRPMEMCMLDDDILFASRDRLYRIHNFQKEILFDLQKEGIFKNTFHDALGFTSIAALDDSHVYAGIDGGYMEFDLTNKSYKYYKYKN